jgi:hypothetical protein
MHAIPATACGCTTRQRSWNPTLGCHDEDEPASAPWPRTRTLYAEPVLCNLHASAPDLLATLQEALGWCQQDAANEDGHPTQEMLEARVKEIRATIAKATGA